MPEAAVKLQLGTDPLRQRGSGPLDGCDVHLQRGDKVRAERLDVELRAALSRVEELRPSEEDVGLAGTEQCAPSPLLS
jgi:hypothetical protein